MKASTARVERDGKVVLGSAEFPHLKVVCRWCTVYGLSLSLSRMRLSRMASMENDAGSSVAEFVKPRLLVTRSQAHI